MTFQTITSYHPKSPVELALDRFKAHLNTLPEEPNSHQLRHIKLEEAIIRTLSQVEQRLEEYQGWVRTASVQELKDEEHSSIRLGRNLRAAGRPKPDDRCDAHAIVAGKHGESTELRLRLAMKKIGVDEADNGCWLPRSWSKDNNHWALPHAVPHSRIHRKTYYRWLERSLPPSFSPAAFRTQLQVIGRQLQYEKSEIPSWVKEWEHA